MDEGPIHNQITKICKLIKRVTWEVSVVICNLGVLLFKNKLLNLTTNYEWKKVLCHHSYFIKNSQKYVISSRICKLTIFLWKLLVVTYRRHHRGFQDYKWYFSYLCIICEPFDFNHVELVLSFSPQTHLQEESICQQVQSKIQ